MELNQKNLENHGWLFSPSLGAMVREHECGGGKWDVELDSYRNVGTDGDPCYEPTQEFFNSADTLSQLISEDPQLARVRDWIDGDKVEML
jgi:hypothetical protein